MKGKDGGAEEGKGHWGAGLSLGPGAMGLATLCGGIAKICASSWPMWQKETAKDLQKLQVNRRKPTEATAGAGPSQ